jgi:hypothetical protein
MTAFDSTSLLKRCSRCKRNFPSKYPFFNRTKNKKSGLEYHCRGCRYKWSDDEFQLNVLRHVLLERSYKQCRDCESVKPFDQYMKSRSCVGGRRPECSECAKKFAKEYHYREDIQQKTYKYNRSEEVKQRRRKYESEPDYKARKSEYDTKPERRAIKNEYQRREDVKARKREYYKQPEVKKQTAIHKLRRRSRELSVEHTLTAQEWKRALEYFDNCCAVCGCSKSKTRTIAIDHWMPLSKGGATTALNIVPLCHSLKGDQNGCNNLKNARLPEKWLLERYGAEIGQVILFRINQYFNWVKDQEEV